MGYTYRIKCRVKEEGVPNTIKYILYASSYSLYNDFMSIFLDLRYSGRLLHGNLKSAYKHLGANDTYHTDYSVMPIIFKNVEIAPETVLVDIGCGKGRVINFWLSKKYTNRIYGLELDPVIASQTAAQFSKWENVKIISGDAISHLPTDGTLFYFYNPFSEEKVKDFENRLADPSQFGKVQIIYYNPKSLHVFDDSKWQIRYINFERDYGIKRWGRINKYHDLAIITRR